MFFGKVNPQIILVPSQKQPVCLHFTFKVLFPNWTIFALDLFHCLNLVKSVNASGRAYGMVISVSQSSSWSRLNNHWMD